MDDPENIHNEVLKLQADTRALWWSSVPIDLQKRLMALAHASARLADVEPKDVPYMHSYSRQCVVDVAQRMIHDLSAALHIK